MIVSSKAQALGDHLLQLVFPASASFAAMPDCTCMQLTMHLWASKVSNRKVRSRHVLAWGKKCGDPGRAVPCHRSGIREEEDSQLQSGHHHLEDPGFGSLVFRASWFQGWGHFGFRRWFYDWDFREGLDVSAGRCFCVLRFQH